MNPTNKDQAKAQLDKTLQGNDKIETAIAALQQDATEEMLAHVLTVIRRRMKEYAQLIVAVEPPKGDGKINLQAIKTGDGKQWWAAFTSFDEELKAAARSCLLSQQTLTKFFTQHSRNHLLKE